MKVSGQPAYTDAAGRRWAVEKLDQLLEDAEVRTVAEGTYRASLDADGTFRPGAAYATARQRYKREECGALLHILVVRLRDREGTDEHV